MNKPKTYKRELAIVLLVLLLMMTIYVLVGSPPEIQLRILELFAPLVFAYVAMAFGMQWFSTQYKNNSEDAIFGSKKEFLNEEGEVKG